MSHIDPIHSAAPASQETSANGNGNGHAHAASHAHSNGHSGNAHMLWGSDKSVILMLWRQRKLIGLCAAACFVLSLFYLLCASKVYTATSQVLVQKAEPLLTNEPRANDSSDNDNFLETQCDVIRSTPILAAVLGSPQADDWRTLDRVSNRMSYLKRNLTAEVGKKDDIITVSFASKYPDEAVKIVDAAVDSYSKYTAGRQSCQTANEVLDILEKEKQKNQNELDAKNTQIIELKRESHTMSFTSGDKNNYAMQRLNSLSDALTAAHLETINSKTELDSAAKSIGLDADSIPANLGNGIALSATDEATLRAEIVGLTQQLQERRRVYLPDHPIVRSLEAQINQLNMAYVGASKVRYEQAKEREVELTKSYNDEQNSAMNMSVKASQAQQLEADTKRLGEVIDGLETRIKDVSITVDSGALNVTVLENANYEDNPVSPSKAQVPLIGIVLGLLIGCVTAVMRELADPKLYSGDDVKAIGNIPVLGLIPRRTPAGTHSVLGQIVHLDPHSPVSEAMRAVRTSLQYGVPADQLRSILVTSPEAGDGKSTLASNLAIALASSGKRVLLIDGDLRNSAMHEIFGVNNERGFANLLHGDDGGEIRVQRTNIARLSLLPAGPAPVNPCELLNHPTLGEMLRELYQQYDHVVIDSPPVTRVDDARILAAMCDCTILVARAEKTSQAALRASVDRLADVGAVIIGAILNGAQGTERYGRYGSPGVARSASFLPRDSQIHAVCG